ncbi:hypothetical protein [Hydrocarboniclastica marina]|uniref:LPP20 family lipoprotein n=1 Tax=Hydrocarboniclastica marina TaxID=2259620 RepID=A0A4P7XLT2_9ALTE|nr:hypothetical protein [Hydrocarboniclastica marina]QCF28078.1 hypothetical protein soil367_18570 [Hydrocarboniclastica marina]
MTGFMKASFAALAVTVISGCASTPDRIELAEEQARLSELRYEQAQSAAAREDERLRSAMDNLPGWFLEPPQPDVGGIYGVGSAQSNDLQVALKKARLTADFELAQQLEQELSGLEKDFAADSNGSANVQYQAAVERFVSAVPMAGQEVAEQKVVVADGMYTAYVLSRLSFDQMDRMLDRRKQNAEDLTRMEQAFAELRERVEASETAESKAAVQAAGVETTAVVAQ